MDWVRFGPLAVLIGAAVVVFALWVLVLRGGDESMKAGEPQAMTASELADFVGSIGHPVYWAGPQEDTTYELTKTPDGGIFIRYLASGTPVGDDSPRYLTVGTYPVKDAPEVLRSASKQEGAISEKTIDGSLAVSHAQQPTSVYMADQGSQIEVYDPLPEHALELALSGKIVPVPAN